MNILTAFLLVAVTWAVWTGLQLYRNYKVARSIGLPIIISPTFSINPLWIISYKLCPSILKLLPLLPFNLGRWARYTYMGWQFDDKYAIHAKLGPAFVICSPSINEVHVADPKACHTILSSRKDFIKPAAMYEPLNVFGKNVNAAEGELWQRHRKLTAPNFNERVSSSVWEESVRQASEMLPQWMAASGEGTRETVDDTSKLTLHVFTYAGFGIKYPFSTAHDEFDPPHQMSYREALHLVGHNFTFLAILPISALKWPLWPKHMRKVGLACDEYRSYLREMVEREKRAFNPTNAREAGNLLTALVHANQAEKHGLDDDELYGNLFMFNQAGHETTANTLATAIAYLTMNPAVQDWIHEELRTVMQDAADSESWSYEDSFPRLKRCRAVMLETLRIHGSIVFIPKAAAAPSQTISIKGITHVIPEGDFVAVNVQALHTDTKTWGKDALLWRPDRWIEASAQPGQEELIEPTPGSFVPWTEGPRVCPGKKFSQVVFVGAIGTLFRNAIVTMKQERGETQGNMVQRMQTMIDNSTIGSMTLQMMQPKAEALVWKKR